MMSNLWNDPIDRRKFLKLGGVGAAGMALGSAGLFPEEANAEKKNKGQFKGKVVIITGATSGIGRATAIAFAAEGAKVGFCGRREELGRQVEQEIRNSGGEATYVKADVRVPEQVQAFVNTIADLYGGLHIAFNNAGVSFFKPLHEISIDEFSNMHDTNSRGVFLAMKYQIPHMLASGGGNIIITSSVAGFATRPGGTSYASSKRSLLGMVQAAALDYGEKGIRVNSVAPGTVNTPMVRELLGATDMDDAEWEALIAGWAKEGIPATKRIIQPEEIAQTVLMLASDDIPSLTGATVVVDGGMTSTLPGGSV